MAFSRNSLAAAVAGTLSLAVLTGCPAPTAPTGTPSPTPTTGTPGASAAPTTTPGASAAPTTPGASVAPSTTPSATPLQPTTLRGKVYDLEGATVSTGAKVTVKSLNPSSPFESTVDVISGSYVVNNVPAGVQLEISAGRDGWTKRTRVETLLPLASTQPNIVNFGSTTTGTSEDPEGDAYFISKYPEIMSTMPADDAENVDPTKLTYVLTLSEPLDATNQRRFANAIRVFPANQYASPAAAATDLEDSGNVTAVVDGTSGYPYAVEEGTLFLDDDDTRATVTWDAAGQVATLTFNAPLISNETEAAKYQVGLVNESASTTDNKIQDKENNQLGTNEAGSLESYPATGNLILNTFKEVDLSLAGASTETTGTSGTIASARDYRWAVTHENVSTFEVAEDNTDPQLTAVSVSEVGTDTRIQLTFSEPMAAFNGTTAGYARGTVLDVANYTFAVGETAADLDDVTLDGDVNTTTVFSTPIGDAPAEREVEFRFGANSAPTPTTVEVSSDDPRIVRLVFNTTTLFATNVSAVKARAEAVQDPAGNAITETQADTQVKVGSI